MINNLKFVFRSLINNRLYSIISFAGLAVSLSVCSFIILWVQDELSYDRFHNNADEIYMGVAHFKDSEFMSSVELTSGLFALASKENYAAVTDYCRVRSGKVGYILSDGENVGEKVFLASDDNFFSFFNFPIITSLYPELLRRPDEVVISESLARELFGNVSPIGKMIRTNGKSESFEDIVKSYHIAAVMKDLPTNTSLPRADIIIPQNSDPYDLYSEDWKSWVGCEFISFIRVKKGADIEQLAKDITHLQTSSRDYRYFTLQPLVDLHLYSLTGEPAEIKTVLIFFFIACAIIVISCINYVNLATRRNAKRNHEIGLKKIFGARKTSLFFQLMTESVIIFLAALSIAVFLNLLLIDEFNHLSGKNIYFEWNSWNYWIMYGAMFLVTMILAGIYPALSLSSFKLLNMFHGKLTKEGYVFIRRSLIVFQFIASIVMIAATITLESQLAYIRRSDLGYNKEHIFTCQTLDMAVHFNTVQQELMKNTAIISVNGASDILYNLQWTNTTREWEGKTENGNVDYYGLSVDSMFINNMSIKLIEGTNFVQSGEQQYIINETAAKAMGMTYPVVGKWMATYGERGKIVGVVKDFHFQSLYKKIAPLVIFYNQNPDYKSFARTLYVQTTAQDAGRAIASVQKLWEEYNPNYTFDYSFMDESFNRLYNAHIRTGQLFFIFSFIAILISCMGLFGLVAYTAEAKTKEIGIRKVNGADIFDIVTMLSKEFLKLVFIAMLIAFPLAYYWLDRLLQDFAYRISIGWWIFALSGVITIILTLLTIGRQAIKSASANPVDAIKKE